MVNTQFKVAFIHNNSATKNSINLINTFLLRIQNDKPSEIDKQ